MPNYYKKSDFLKGKSTFEYEREIIKLQMEIKKLKAESELKSRQATLPAWTETVWEQIAHELVWAIGLLEEEPTSPKVWRKMFNVLKSYENLVRTNGKP